MPYAPITSGMAMLTIVEDMTLPIMPNMTAVVANHLNSGEPANGWLTRCTGDAEVDAAIALLDDTQGVSLPLAQSAS